MQTYPRDILPLNNLAVQYMYLGQFEKELENTKKAQELDSSPIHTWFNLLDAYIGLNRFDEAHEAGRQAIARGFDVPRMHVTLLWLAIAQKDTAAYNEELAWLSRHPSSDPYVGQIIFEYDVSLGKLRQSGEEARKVAKDAESSGLQGAADIILAEEAHMQAMVGRNNDARELATLASKTSADWTTSSEAALAYAEMGDFRQAHALFDRLLQTYPENTILKKLFAPKITALELISRHDAGGAVAALDGSQSYDLAGDMSLPYIRGLAYLAAGKSQQAAVEFQKIIDHPGVWPSSPVHSLALLGLGRAYALTSDKVHARTSYQDFFALWKDADPDVPILIEAKAEYAKLKEP
jgi:tetratricopeptide (TPR) repeat protein